MNKLAITIVVLVGLLFTACTSEESTSVTDTTKPEETPMVEPEPEHEVPVTMTTLHPLSCDSAQILVKAYGKWVGDQYCAVAESSPRYWEIDVAEMKAVLDVCASGEENPAKFRIYLGRREFPAIGKELADLLLVPLAWDPAEDSYTEITSSVHDLISPCPSTCGSDTSFLDYSYWNGVNSSAECSISASASPTCPEPN